MTFQIPECFSKKGLELITATINNMILRDLRVKITIIIFKQYVHV